MSATASTPTSSPVLPKKSPPPLKSTTSTQIIVHESKKKSGEKRHGDLAHLVSGRRKTSIFDETEVRASLLSRDVSSSGRLNTPEAGASAVGKLMKEYLVGKKVKKREKNLLKFLANEEQRKEYFATGALPKWVEGKPALIKFLKEYRGLLLHDMTEDALGRLSKSGSMFRKELPERIRHSPETPKIVHRGSGIGAAGASGLDVLLLNTLKDAQKGHVQGLKGELDRAHDLLKKAQEMYIALDAERDKQVADLTKAKYTETAAAREAAAKEVSDLMLKAQALELRLTAMEKDVGEATGAEAAKPSEAQGASKLTAIIKLLPNSGQYTVLLGALFYSLTSIFIEPTSAIALAIAKAFGFTTGAEEATKAVMSTASQSVSSASEAMGFDKGYIPLIMAFVGAAVGLALDIFLWRKAKQHLATIKAENEAAKNPAKPEGDKEKPIEGAVIIDVKTGGAKGKEEVPAAKPGDKPKPMLVEDKTESDDPFSQDTE